MKTMQRTLSVLLFVSLANLASGQMPRSPEPELKKLDFFAGNWRTSGSMNPGPMGKGGPVAGMDHIEWQKGNFFLISRSEYKTPMGEGTELSVMGYDPQQKVYTYESFTSDGEHEVATGTLEGDTWTWKSDQPNSPFKWRYTQKTSSTNRFTSTFEMSQDGSNWITVFQSTSNKQP